MPRERNDFLNLLKSVTAKRPKTVIDHILEYGFITSEELQSTYGYEHPPRAVRDVREYGIPIETYRVSNSNGKKIAAYKFGDIKKTRFSKLSGRTGLSKKIKEELISKYGCKCFIYLEPVDEKDLQIDHRIPFEVSGDGNGEFNSEDFMLLSASANRAKSWSCENCSNWNNDKNEEICLSCYWAYPEEYNHIAMKQVRRVDLIWEEKEIEKYELLKQNAELNNKSIPDFVKDLIDSK
ncbi:hypothetical protein [Sulfuricurvum sp.]|uniref:hypothetical protein n=1 Tax=Sulfuricurvum sp. TaxID=2025608 RepID=UPI003BB7C65C